VTAGVWRSRLVSSIDVGPGAAALGAGAAALAAGAAVAMGPAAIGIPLALAAAIFLVREPLALLTLYTYIGLFKGEAAVKAAPVDLTLALGVLLSGVCFIRWAAGRTRYVPYPLAAAVALIGAMLVVSLGWTPAPAYGGEKALRFVTVTLLATLAPFFLFEQERDLRRYFSWTIVIAAAAAVIALVNGPSHYGRLTITGEGNTIGVSHLLCTAALILLLGALTELLSHQAWAIGGSAALIGVAAAVGSRGPILSLVLALVVTGVVWLMRVPRKVVPVLLIIGAGVAVAPFVSLPQTSAQRLSKAARNPVGALQADPRHTNFGQAIDVIEQHPIVGIGAGGFQTVGRLGVPAEDYPHNMFLEVWSELGIAALIVLATSIIAVLIGLFRGAWLLPNGPPSRLVYVFIGVFLFNLFAAQLTGDLNDNRTFWSTFGLAWLIVQHGVPASAAPRTERE
jgi:O-antigen ligase